jgi:hypothetical protein
MQRPLQALLEFVHPVCWYLQTRVVIKTPTDSHHMHTTPTEQHKHTLDSNYTQKKTWSKPCPPPQQNLQISSHLPQPLSFPMSFCQLLCHEYSLEPNLGQTLSQTLSQTPKPCRSPSAPSELLPAAVP